MGLTEIFQTKLDLLPFLCLPPCFSYCDLTSLNSWLRHCISLPLVEGATWNSTEVTITRSREVNGVILEADGKFVITVLVVPITKEESRVHKYEITDDDCFAHLDIGFKFYGLSEEVNGVLGRTYSATYTSKVNVGAATSVLGGEDKFSSSRIFATDCVVSKFIGDTNVSREEIEVKDHLSLQCEGGGQGVICKR